MIRVENLVIVTSLLIVFSAGILWLLTAIGIPQPINLLAAALASIAVAINL